MLEQIEKNTRALIATCRVIETRVVNRWVLALPEDGQIVTVEGIRTFPEGFGNKIFWTDQKDVAEAKLLELRESNPDNSTVDRLKPMRIKEAAVRQEARARDLLTYLERKLIS
jgi:hypothetical protein